ncbi:FAD-dependent oxidoreductase [Actinacidiphila sp. ITFR-21]|uniref:FAD-dependent oxidoreductase n=1 Tax=Actinacidiphila sp. ITFR-21 TaxID=3075199 RepID=UPI00288923FB|nr:FAD-dependent oxidoreductase [Streptomyces sp. ITFR-21]WNI19447.1 FAD-dependent oxidoreductase [Streptomyces sp. ITFR-21]
MDPEVPVIPPGKDIVIIGGGGAGTLAANRLRARCAGPGIRITVVDRTGHRDPETELLVALGLFGPGTPQPPEHLRLRAGIGFRRAEAASVDTARARVRLAGGATAGYDVLVLATGEHPLPHGLGGARGFVPADPRAARPDAGPEVFAVGAAAGARPPDGPAVHAQVEALADGVRRRLAGDPAYRSGGGVFAAPR